MIPLKNLQKALLLSILAVAGLYLIVREVFPIDNRSGTSHQEMTTRFSFNSRSVKYYPNIDHGSDQLLDLDEYEQFNVHLSNSTKQPSPTHQVIPLSSTMHLDLSLSRFIPLYKDVDFNGSVSFNYSQLVKKEQEIYEISGSGIMSVAGFQEIRGERSGRQVRIDLERDLKKSLIKKVSEHIEGQLASL